MYLTHVFFIVKSLSFFLLSFLIAVLAAPVLIHFLYKYKAWKKKPRDKTVDGYDTPIFQKFHSEKEVKTPRMGGILIWGTVLIVSLIALILSKIFPSPLGTNLNFLSRSQVWLPLFTLIAASLLGLVDDLMVIREKGKYIGGGMRFKWRLFIITIIALVGAWWFYFKLGWSSIYIPFYGNFEIDGLYIILFVLTVLATFSSGVVDGLDGLSAGVLAPVFAAFGVIAYSKGLYDLTTLIVIIIGALLPYLWFNVPPAKFYMGETGILGLTATLAVIASLTNSIFFLPIIGIVLLIEALSVIIQLVSKKLRNGKKVFLAAPIHHHFEAMGWSESQITMRFWILSGIFSGVGIILYFLSKFLY
ncbi:MAG: phospho-N-acetylmuramoyl-pentapeptide-transferase [Patescibacteria group bacterium]|nr:phospho-N-acetylmuramoyl-pentapeptide-transferase [Patescibacteria group bacterium]